MCECGGAGVRGQHASSLASIMSAAEAASLPIASELAICKKNVGYAPCGTKLLQTKSIRKTVHASLI